MSSGSVPRVECPGCHAPLKAIAVNAGERLTCPKCKTMFVVGAATGAADSGDIGGVIGDDIDLLGAIEIESQATRPPTPQRSPALDAFGSSGAGGDDDEYRLSDEPPPPRPASLGVKATAPGAVKAPTSAASPPSRPVGAANPGPPSPPVARSADRFYYSFPCPVCRTQLDCSSEQIGQTIVCPDCESKVRSPRPDPTQMRRTAAAEDGSMNLSDAVHTTFESGPSSPAVLRTHANQALAKAEAELDAESRRERSAVGDKDLRKVFRFFGDPNALFRVVVLTVLTAVVLGLAGAAAGHLAVAKTAFFGVLLGVPAFLLGVYWLAMLAGSGLAVLNSAANGSEQEVSWPDFSPLDLVLQSLPALNALLYSLMPAVLVALAFGAGGELSSATLAAMVVGLLGMVAIFPIVLLSTLHQDSLFSVLSMDILRSIRSRSQYWIMFYQAAIVMAVAAGLAIAFYRVNPGVGLFVLSPLTVLLVLLYFRMLGWLVWRCGDTLLDELTGQEDDGDEE